tara:strand:+ start:29280 stop:30269 length:990 start_codon:yes stop_codon:yes gene_type:complete
MLFMDDEGGFSILNEDSGSWELSDKADERNGVWFSHTRDNGYYLSGVSNTPSKYGWVSNFSDWRGGDTSSSYYSHTNWESFPSTGKKRAKTICSPKSASEQGRLLFVYGEWRDDVEVFRELDAIPNDMASYVREGTAKDVQLWAVEAEDSLIDVRPAAYRATGKGFATKGIVLYLKGMAGVDSTLTKLDKMMSVGDGRYHREQIDVSMTGSTVVSHNGTFPMWTYLASDSNSLVGVVPHGDWDEWLSRMDSSIDTPPVALLDNPDSTDSTVESVHMDDVEYSLCGKCYQSGLVPFSSVHLTIGDEVDQYWCNICKETYPINTTVEIFPV